MTTHNLSSESGFAPSGFDYDLAFSRNLGLVQPEEQLRLRQSNVAIAGLGGVGGVHLTTLARMGIGKFHIADFDHFEVQNFNRQAGALMSTLGRKKVEVMEAMARDINPEVSVNCFPQGITPENVADFLDGVDVVVDGLDFFAVAARDMLYRAAYSRNIPVVVAGPIGASAAFLVFLPGQMRWQDYFAMDLAKNEVDNPHSPEKGIGDHLSSATGIPLRTQNARILSSMTCCSFSNMIGWNYNKSGSFVAPAGQITILFFCRRLFGGGFFFNCFLISLRFSFLDRL